MDNFDKLLEEYSSGKTRVIKKTERYPRNIILSRDFLESLEAEYFQQNSGDNRNFHSNFLKALSFELDKYKSNPELMAKYAVEEVADDLDIPVHEIDAEEYPEEV